MFYEVCFKLVVTWQSYLFIWIFFVSVQGYWEGEFQISSDLLSRLIVCIDVCGCQILFQGRMIKFHI